jgi:CRISPR-associated protein Cmr1
MPRPVPPPPPSLAPPSMSALTVQLQTITPMFGGSARTREVDESHPVRAASVRGHLRFWWRATAGAQYASATELFKAETAIWGGSEKQGQLQKDKHGLARVEVATMDSGLAISPSELGIQGGRSAAQTGPLEGYFVYPFRQEQERKEALGRQRVKFKVTVTLNPLLTSTQQQEIRLAILAWICFGGVGARIRRGCGALQAIGENSKDWTPANSQALWTLFASEEPKQTAVQHTILAGGRLHLRHYTQKDAAMQAWRDLGRFWAHFRKGHYTERRPLYSPMSGSAWYDHQTLRRLNSQATTVALIKPFLGLPIVYQRFKGEVYAGTVSAKAPHGTRFASPVILKPLALQDGIAGLVLILNGPAPQKIQLSTLTASLDLTVPEHDPVLTTLKVRSPLLAVSKAAVLSDYIQEVRL